MSKWLLIAVGGAAGSMLRYALHGLVQRWAGVNFPVGTLAVNVLGCLVIGFLAAFFAGPTLVREEYRLGLTVGLLGGFTTFSAFGLETFHLAESGRLPLALANVVLSCSIGLLGVWLGYRVGEQWFGA